MGRWIPRPTLRLRLTLLYGGLFLAAGAVLLAITYELVSHSDPVTSRANFLVAGPAKGGPKLPVPVPAAGVSGARFDVHGQAPTSGAGQLEVQAYAGRVTATFRKITSADQRRLQRFADKAKRALQSQQSAQLDALLTQSGIALGIMAILSIGLGWLTAGRALRPVRTMSTRARGISERNLHERLGIVGPNDELKELADTFDELLARLESAFDSQRRFVANASHELRTPITLERTLIEVALADPDTTIDSLRATCHRVLAAGEQQERMIEALLTLARSQRGLESRQPVDLAAIAGDAVSAMQPDGIDLRIELEDARTAGDPALIERLVSNVLDNAVRYNEPCGWVEVRTEVDDGVPIVRVTNSGLLVRASQIGTLTEPFRRLNGDRTDQHGLGLGLSIVAAIAAAHGAELRTSPRAEGGLEVEVRFQPVAACPESSTGRPIDRGEPLEVGVGA